MLPRDVLRECGMKNEGGGFAASLYIRREATRKFRDTISSEVR